MSIKSSGTQFQMQLLKKDHDRMFKTKRLVIQKYQTNDIPPPKVKTDYPEINKLSSVQNIKRLKNYPINKKVDFKLSERLLQLSANKNLFNEQESTMELPSHVGSEQKFSAYTSGTVTPSSTSEFKVPATSSAKKRGHPSVNIFKIKSSKLMNVLKVFQSKQFVTHKNKGKSTTCMQDGMKLIWTTRGQGNCADEERPIKKFTKLPQKMPRLLLFDYLRIWDVSSSFRRYDMLKHFLKSYVSVEPLDFDYYLSRGGTLIFSRFTIGMQIAFQRRKPVWMYFQALGVFIKSLQGERFMYEFMMMGGMATAFEVLRVDEMSFRDKTNVFYFLYRLIDGQGGTRVKQFICRDSSSLESVVDCLTMCKNSTVINFARVYLQNLCIGNTMGNLYMISRYVISLLTCDFNPPLQQMACQVLPYIVHQNGETARHCYSHLVDVLRTDFTELLVDVGDLAIAIMATSVADDFLAALNGAAQPSSISEDLALMGNEYSLSPTSTPSTPTITEARRLTPTHDTSLRQQYGALYVLSYMLKNRTEFADWMVEKGVIGSLLAAIGTSAYTEVQLSAVRLLLLIHELSPDCAVALAFLLPKKLLVVILDQEEGCLAYLTAVMCMALRRMGRLVQWNWIEWFNEVVVPETTESPDSELTPSPIVTEITSIKNLLDELIGEYFYSIIEKVDLPIPDPSFFESRTDDQKSRRSSRINVRTEPLTPGELRVLQDDDLEPFRKYIHQRDSSSENKDEFDQYYGNKFTDDNDYDMGGMEMARLRDAEKALAKFKDREPNGSQDVSSHSQLMFSQDESTNEEIVGEEGDSFFAPTSSSLNSLD